MSEDVDPEDPRPPGHHPADADSTWYDIDDDLATNIATSPATETDLNPLSNGYRGALKIATADPPAFRPTSGRRLTARGDSG